MESSVFDKDCGSEILQGDRPDPSKELLKPHSVTRPRLAQAHC